ncbi:hypothetical protein PLICRDRAFT_161615 [Plicaturopsis crispa FD-325 SS-3]|nr:hypothetical protein PLICRDRAFT_161615 [Plicaturopsis crispa FD-325 SS-3]
MASRRAAPSRAGRNNNTAMAPPASTRPRSAMAKPSSSVRSTPVEDPDAAGPSTRQTRPTKDSEDAETNIQVVIRCRRRSEREIQESSPIIVSSSGARSGDVTIETSIPVSSLGVVSLPPTRTYPFDLVFGPEADQAMIYHDVVSPMLEEVMQGYNCTLFAYGQTGTGKTYTMQGDLTPTPMGNPSAQAGMIPRVLFRLFHQLEASGSDYSVKISFVELYNEELRDLLASDLAAPTSSTQPMGHHHTSRPTATDSGALKIFDDASKRGVFIQGLEEMPVKDATDALALLTKGSDRRQIASTKFNDHSSRSHSVFSVTVHIKETSNVGDDLLKIGKLNLVDLAGSENIGRSGAENKRAREAGMINQSLLTLGRVINALVDRSSHVPYRESKLTRLLQDSLGGRTKTCIIATISPARSNMEETLSTLDYAIRAKSIRNKPELNQRMTRNALLKEYVTEIERLKSDVLAAREKNGIFFSEETWKEMSTEQEMRQTECEEAKKQVDIVESQLRAVREEFEQSIGLLMKRDTELKETKDRLRNTEGELEVTTGQLRVVKSALEEEVVVRQAFQDNEAVIDGVAGGLKKVAKESVGDLGNLFSKLERKTSVFSSNSKAVLKHGKTIASEAHNLSTKLDEFIKTSTQNTLKLRAEAKQYQTKELQALANHSERIDQQLQRVQDALSVIQSKEDVSTEALASIQIIVKETHESFQSGFVAWSESLKATCAAMCKEVEASSMTGLSTVEKALKGIGSLVDAVIREAHAYVEAERASALEAKSLVNSAASAEITRLQEQNTLLTRLLEAEKTKGERAKDELLQRVSGLIGDFTAARDRSLREAMGVVQEGNREAAGSMQSFDSAHGKAIDGMVMRGSDVAMTLDKRGGESKRTRDGAIKALSSSKTSFHDSLSNIQKSVSGSLSTYSDEMQKQTQTMNVTCTGAFDRHARAKRARIDATTAMATDVQSEYRSLQRGVASTSRNVEEVAGRIISETNSLSKSADLYHNAASNHLSSVEHATRSIVEEGTHEDSPTGTTPRKRVWQYVDQWEVTKPREKILKAWRQKGVSNAGNETFVAEHLPLPEEEEDADTTEGDDVPGTPRVEPIDEPESIPPVESPLAMSIASSTSSTSGIARPTMPPPKMTRAASGAKSGLPTLGTLTDRPTNVGTRRRAR